MKKHFSIKITGRVQGVFFRVSAKEQADYLGISGFACNEPDGSVVVEAEGEEDALNRFLIWCREGPAGARVENMEITEGAMEDFDDFSIQ